MREIKNLDISINTFNFKNCNNFQIRHYVALAQNKSSIKVGRKLPTFYSSV